MSNPLYSAALALAVACFSSIPDALAEEETSTEILAAHIRGQGFDCDKAESATREQSESRPNETVWILKCKDDVYRVTLVPDLAAKVEKLSK